MSNEQFTLGKWSVKSDTDPFDIDYDGRFSSVGWTGIASEAGEIIGLAVIEGMDDEQLEANARLMAKSPEMYAMLKQVRGELYQLIEEVNEAKALSDTEPFHSEETVDAIDAILAEIRGEQC